MHACTYIFVGLVYGVGYIYLAAGGKERLGGAIAQAVRTGGSGGIHWSP